MATEFDKMILQPISFCWLSLQIQEVIQWIYHMVVTIQVGLPKLLWNLLRQCNRKYSNVSFGKFHSQ
jgi:hypothetical protein